MDSLNDIIWNDEDLIEPQRIIDGPPMPTICEISIATCSDPGPSSGPPYPYFTGSVYGNSANCGC